MCMLSKIKQTLMAGSITLLTVASASAFNFTVIWDLIDEITDHTDSLINLVILGVIITIATVIGMFLTRILMSATGKGRMK